MLIGYYIVLIFRIGRLVLGRNVDLFMGQLRRAVELFEKVGDAGVREVNVGVGGIFGLAPRLPEGDLWKG